MELENNAGKDGRHEQRSGMISTCGAVKWRRTLHPGREVSPLTKGRERCESMTGLKMTNGKRVLSKGSNSYTL